MGNFKKLLCVALVVILAFCVIAGCGAKTSAKIRLNEVTHSVFYAPMYAAISLGFYEEEGLEIELTNGGGADKTMTALLSGQADIGLAGPETSVYVYNEGREDHTVVIGQLTKRDGSFLMSRKDEPNFKWENLKGSKIIGGRKGGMPEMTLEYVLKNKGLTPGVDVEVDTSIQFNLMGGAFEGGEGDYVTLFEPTASMFQKEGKGYIVAAVGAASGEVPFTAFAATKSYVEKNPDIVQRFVNATYKGLQWVAANEPEKIAEAVKPHFPDTSEEELIMVAKSYKEIDAWMTDLVMKEDSFERMQEIMTLAGELEKKAPYDKIIDNTFAEKAMK